MQLIQTLYHKTRISGFDAWWGPWKFSSDVFLLSSFNSPGVHSARNFLGHKMWLACGPDNSAFLVVPNLKVRKEVQHCTHPPHPSLHDVLWESFTFNYCW